MLAITRAPRGAEASWVAVPGAARLARGNRVAPTRGSARPFPSQNVHSSVLKVAYRNFAQTPVRVRAGVRTDADARGARVSRALRRIVPKTTSRSS